MTINTPCFKRTLLNNAFASALFIFTFFVGTTATAHWATNGPYGGSVSAFATIDTTVFLASPTGGVYASTSSSLGAWTYANYTGLGSGKITALATIGHRLLAGSADKGIYISNNLGVSWAVSNSGLVNKNVLSLIKAGSKIYAGTAGGGVYQSSDSGATWVAVDSGLTNLNVNAFTATHDTVFAGTQGGVFVTIDTAHSWLPLNVGLTDTNVLALAYSNSGVFAGTPSGVFQGSLSLGWNSVNTGLNDSFVNTLYLHSDTLFAGTNAGVYSSPVSAIAWNNLGTLSDTIKALLVHGTDLLAGSTKRGVLEAIIFSPGWVTINNGFNNLQSYAMAAKDSLVAVANEQGVFVCSNFQHATAFVSRNNGITDSLHVTALAIKGTTIYAGTANDGVFVSADSGATWTTANTGLTDMNISKLYNAGTTLYAATDSGKVFKTLLSAINWTNNTTGLPANAVITQFTSLADTVLLSAGSNGIYKSVAGGSWTNVPASQPVNTVTISNDYTFIGTPTAGAFRSPLSAHTFTAVNSSLPTSNIDRLYSLAGYVVAGYKGGAKASCTNGRTWHNFTDLLYIPNYSDIIDFADVASSIFVLLPNHGLLGNDKAALPSFPADTITGVSGTNHRCGAGAISLSVAADSESVSYTWALPTGWSGASTTNSISITTNASGGVVSVTGTNGCGASPAKTDTIAVNAIPTVTIGPDPDTICNNDPAVIIKSGHPLGGFYSTNFAPDSTGPGTYTIIYSYTSPGSCTAADTEKITIITCAAGIDEPEAAFIQVYPNPVENEIMVKTSGISGRAMVTLTDITGRIVIRNETSNLQTSFSMDASSLSNGVYMLNISTADGKNTLTQKVVKL